MMAGCPLKRGFSTSASRDAANAVRSVLQKRHLIAAALMVSPQTGQALVSSLMGRGRHASLQHARSGRLSRDRDHVEQFTRLFRADRFTDKDVGGAQLAT